jgi:hypothetical protein
MFPYPSGAGLHVGHPGELLSVLSEPDISSVLFSYGEEGAHSVIQEDSVYE